MHGESGGAHCLYVVETTEDAVRSLSFCIFMVLMHDRHSLM